MHTHTHTHWGCGTYRGRVDVVENSRYIEHGTLGMSWREVTSRDFKWDGHVLGVYTHSCLACTQITILKTNINAEHITLCDF